MSDLSSWSPRPTPGSETLAGARVSLAPLDWTRDSDGLFAAVGGEANAAMWTWMPVGPWASKQQLGDFLAAQREASRWRTMTIRDAASADVLGMAAYMRIREADGSAEIGCVAFGPKLQRTAHATEALWLMAGHVFALGYRRYEWKCNQRNDASKRSAERFGFVFEGIFRNDMVMKGMSRDTAWYSIIDTEWPRLDAALRAWLAPVNFAADGSQRRTLESLRSG